MPGEDGFMTKITTNDVATFVEEMVQKNGRVKLDVYPNPTAQNITIELPNIEIGKAVLHVYNTNGQLLETKDLNLHLKEYQVSFPNLPKGAYISKITTSQNTYVFSFIKE
ncbi:MAG: T9SS type A sorting domain-containing protein [Salibacteraceae bacterium]